MNPSKRKKLFRLKANEEKKKAAEQVTKVEVKKEEPVKVLTVKETVKEEPKKEEVLLVTKEETVLVKEELKKEETVSLQGEMIGVVETTPVTPPVAAEVTNFDTSKKKKKQ
jgi:hypothetical protein